MPTMKRCERSPPIRTTPSRINQSRTAFDSFRGVSGFFPAWMTHRPRCTRRFARPTRTPISPLRHFSKAHEYAPSQFDRHRREPCAKGTPLHMARADGGQTEMVRTHEPLRNASAEILVFVLAERTAAYIADGVSSKPERTPRLPETNRRQFSIG